MVTTLAASRQRNVCRAARHCENVSLDGAINQRSNGSMSRDSTNKLWERLVSRDGWTLVQEWVATNVPETVTLEFKKKSKPATSALDEFDRANIARTISGFANTEGGIFGFGFDADEKRKGDPDTLQRLQSIPDLQNCVARIQDELHELTHPAVRGLSVHPLEDPNAKGTGVVLLHIPESDGGPHRVSGRATAHVLDRYYMRTSSSTVVMPHTMVGAMFGKKPEPHVKLVARVVTNETGDPYVALRLQNIGRGTAAHPLVVLTRPEPRVEWESAARGWDWLLRDRSAGPFKLEDVPFYCNSKIYPQFESVVVTARMKCENLTLRATVYVLDGRPREFEGFIARPGHWKKQEENGDLWLTELGEGSDQ